MDNLLDRPRLLGLFCAAGAVCLGLAYMVAAGAPTRYMVVNLAALLLGATVWLALGPRASSRLAFSGGLSWRWHYLCSQRRCSAPQLTMLRAG